MSSDRRNYNIIHLLYQQTTKKNVDKIGFITFNNLLQHDSSPSMVNKIRNVIIEADSKNIPVYTTDNFPNKDIKKKLVDHFTTSVNLSNTPYMFIPRDAGFFSVFNYLIGSICRGFKLYPYFNRDIMMNIHGSLQHFCYLDTTIDNSWFHYFEPISYFEDDDTHTKALYKDFTITGGQMADHVFTGPKHTLNLYKSSHFPTWRKTTHQVFTNFIRVKPDILQASSQISQDFKKQMIGVHFRNPSHWSEQGLVQLDDYFSKIDQLLRNHDNLGIYLATDTDFGLAAFTMRYPGLIVYNPNCQRGSMDYFLSWAYQRNDHRTDNFSFTTGIHNQKCNTNNLDVSLGKDVILDVILLSKCNWLVHTLSNLSLAISYWNTDCEMILLEGQYPIKHNAQYRL